MFQSSEAQEKKEKAIEKITPYWVKPIVFENYELKSWATEEKRQRSYGKVIPY